MAQKVPAGPPTFEQINLNFYMPQKAEDLSLSCPKNRKAAIPKGGNTGKKVFLFFHLFACVFTFFSFVRMLHKMRQR